MNTQEKIFLIMVVASLAWIVAVLFFRYGKRTIRQIITVNKNHKEDILKNNVMAPREFVVNLMVDKGELQNLDVRMFADMAVKWKDLKEGNYKVPTTKANDILIEQEEPAPPKDKTIDVIPGAREHLALEKKPEVQESKNDKDFLFYLDIDELFSTKTNV